MGFPTVYDQTELGEWDLKTLLDFLWSPYVIWKGIRKTHLFLAGELAKTP